MKLILGAFGRTGIEMHAGGDVAGAVAAAGTHYAAQIGSGRASLKCPAFRGTKLATGEQVDVEPSMGRDIMARLEREARSQKVRLERLLEHAVFVYLADLDSGRSARVPPGWMPEG